MKPTVTSFNRGQKVQVAVRGGGTKPAHVIEDNGGANVIIRFGGQLKTRIVAREYVYAE